MSRLSLSIQQILYYIGWSLPFRAHCRSEWRPDQCLDMHGFFLRVRYDLPIDLILDADSLRNRNAFYGVLCASIESSHFIDSVILINTNSRWIRSRGLPRKSSIVSFRCFHSHILTPDTASGNRRCFRSCRIARHRAFRAHHWNL